MGKYPAVSLDDAWRACDPDEALTPEDERRVELNAVRSDDPDMSTIIGKAISRCREDKCLYKLVTGHKGSGKTTELLWLTRRLKADKHFVVYMDHEKMLDLGDATYLDVLLAITQALGEALETEDVAINEKLLEDIRLWFAEKVLTTVEDESDAVSGSAGVELKAGFWGIGKLFAKATAEIKSASSQREEIRLKLDRNLSTFLELLKRFVLDARMKVMAKGYCSIVLIADGLEKMRYRHNKEGVSNQFDMFIHHADQLKIPHCHVIYTLPISLAFKAQIADAWPSGYYSFPMIKQNSEAGRAALREVARKRVDIEKVFETPDTLDDFISLSGGAVRDLLRLIQTASLYSEDRIGRDDGRKAIAAFLREVDRLIQEKDKDKLAKVCDDKKVPNADGYEYLLANRLIHEYQNGGRWADVHPAVKILLKMQDRPVLKTYLPPS